MTLFYYNVLSSPQETRHEADALRAELEAARAGLGQSAAELQVALPPLL
mgnify:CR=1 FL=1|jgi:hypothetical protein